MAYLLKIHSSPFLSVAVETNITALFAATKLFLLLLNLILTFFLISCHLVMYPVLRLNQLLTLSCSCQYYHTSVPNTFRRARLLIYKSLLLFVCSSSYFSFIVLPAELLFHFSKIQYTNTFYRKFGIGTYTLHLLLVFMPSEYFPYRIFPQNLQLCVRWFRS